MTDPSPADELAKFAVLRNQGVITEAEFQAKKAQLLGLPEPAPAASATPSSYDVVLEAAGPKPINVIKIIRKVTGLGLVEAKHIVDTTPTSVVVTTPDPEAADALVRLLANAGATAVIAPR
jgi:large subunit ribosomal protein L7/L12